MYHIVLHDLSIHIMLDRAELVAKGAKRKNFQNVEGGGQWYEGVEAV